MDHPMKDYNPNMPRHMQQCCIDEDRRKRHEFIANTGKALLDGIVLLACGLTILVYMVGLS